MIHEPLAYYRFFGQDHTAMVRTASHFLEIERLAKFFAANRPDFSWSRHRQRIAKDAWYQAERYRKAGVAEGYEANIRYFKEYGSPWLKTRLRIKGIFKNLTGQK